MFLPSLLISVYQLTLILCTFKQEIGIEVTATIQRRALAEMIKAIFLKWMNIVYSDSVTEQTWLKYKYKSVNPRERPPPLLSLLHHDWGSLISD